MSTQDDEMQTPFKCGSRISVRKIPTIVGQKFAGIVERNSILGFRQEPYSVRSGNILCRLGL